MQEHHLITSRAAASILERFGVPNAYHWLAQNRQHGPRFVRLGDGRHHYLYRELDILDWLNQRGLLE